jgi:hypothetical protein
MVPDEFEQERRFLVLDGEQQDGAFGAGEGHVEQPSFFGMGEVVTFRHGQPEYRIIDDRAGETVGSFGQPGNDDIVGFESFGSVDGLEPYIQVLPPVPGHLAGTVSGGNMLELFAVSAQD